MLTPDRPIEKLYRRDVATPSIRYRAHGSVRSVLMVSTFFMVDTIDLPLYSFNVDCPDAYLNATIRR